MVDTNVPETPPLGGIHRTLTVDGEFVVNNMIDAGDYVFHAYIIESSVGDLKLMDAVTLESNGNCHIKVRYTAVLEYPSANPLTDGLGEFAERSHEFFLRLVD